MQHIWECLTRRSYFEYLNRKIHNSLKRYPGRYGSKTVCVMVRILKSVAGKDVSLNLFQRCVFSTFVGNTVERIRKVAEREKYCNDFLVNPPKNRKEKVATCTKRKNCKIQVYQKSTMTIQLSPKIIKTC